MSNPENTTKYKNRQKKKMSRRKEGLGSKEDLTREWITGFLRYPLLDLVEITQASLRGSVRGVWVHLQALLRASPQVGLWVSAAQKHNSQYKVVFFSLHTQLYFFVYGKKKSKTSKCVKHVRLWSAA